MIFDGNFSGTKAARRDNVMVKKQTKAHDSDEEIQHPDENDSFYWPPQKEILLGTRFANVHIYMTEKVSVQGNEEPVRKWLDTKMRGFLKLVVVQDVGVPIVNLRLYGGDAAGNE